LLSKNQYESTIINHWCERLDCTADDFRRSGTSIRFPPAFAGASEIYLHSMGPHTVVRIDPDLTNVIDLQHGQELDETLDVDSLPRYLRDGYRLQFDGRGPYRYLHSDAFRPHIAGGSGQLRQLTLPKDVELVHGLTSRCAPDDVEEAEIEDERPDDIIYGYLVDGQLVAYSGFRYWYEHFADIGVLTDPQWRGRGLGKVVVSMVSRWCLQHDVIPLYRAEESNTRSWHIAVALGYELKVVATNTTVVVDTPVT